MLNEYDQFTEKNFNARAADYKDGCVKQGWNMHNILVQKVIQASKKLTNVGQNIIIPRHVLDLGSNVGLVSAAVKAFNSAAKTYGVDLAGDALAIGVKNNNFDHTYKQSFVDLSGVINSEQAEAKAKAEKEGIKIAEEVGKFDWVIASGASEFVDIDNLEKTVSEILKTLNHGGIGALSYEPILKDNGKVNTGYKRTEQHEEASVIHLFNDLGGKIIDTDYIAEAHRRYRPKTAENEGKPEEWIANRTIIFQKPLQHVA